MVDSNENNVTSITINYLLRKKLVKNVIFLALLNRESKFGMSHIVCDGYHVASSSQVLYASNLMKLTQPNALD